MSLFVSSYYWIIVLIFARVTHQAAVLRLQQFRGATLSVQGVKGLDPQRGGVRHAYGVPGNTQICKCTMQLKELKFIRRPNWNNLPKSPKDCKEMKKNTHTIFYLQ